MKYKSIKKPVVDELTYIVYPAYSLENGVFVSGWTVFKKVFHDEDTEQFDLEKEYDVFDGEEYTTTDNRTYEQKVEDFIREKYTVSDELAILRQRDTKPEEYAEYYAYCEECKAKSK